MDYSTKISERMWNQRDKGELEAERENTFKRFDHEDI